MAEKTHVYEIIKSYDSDKVLATLWWDGNKVQSDNEDFLKDLKEDDSIGASISDGPKWLGMVASKFKNGYLHARRVE